MPYSAVPFVMSTHWMGKTPFFSVLKLSKSSSPEKRKITVGVVPQALSFFWSAST